jgi:hypothetical protein
MIEWSRNEDVGKERRDVQWLGFYTPDKFRLSITVGEN